MVFRVTIFVWIFAVSSINNTIIQTSDEAEVALKESHYTTEIQIVIISYLKEPNQLKHSNPIM